MSRASRLSSSLVLALALAVPGAALVAPAPAAAQVPEVNKVALVDMQRVLNETKQGKKARKNLESSSVAKEKKLEKKRIKLEGDQAKIRNMPAAQQQAAMEKLQREAMELQSMYMTMQQELATQEAKLLEKIYKNSQAIVKEMAKKEGVDLVLVRDDTTVLYAKDSFDLTDALIKRYDAKHK